MTSPEHPAQPLATAEQAGNLLREVGDLAVLRGDGRSYTVAGGGAPAEVQSHFPSADPTSLAVYDSLRVVQNFDAVTGVPKQQGTAGVISFTRTERRDQRLTYVTQADYAINTVDGGNTYGLSRHVMSFETGTHKKMGEEVLANILEATALSPEQAAESQAARDQMLADEQALGLHDVSETEAAQIINTLQLLKPATTR